MKKLNPRDEHEKKTRKNTGTVIMTALSQKRAQHAEMLDKLENDGLCLIEIETESQSYFILVFEFHFASCKLCVRTEPFRQHTCTAFIESKQQRCSWLFYGNQI